MRDILPSRKLERTIQAAMDVPDPSSQFLAELGDKLDVQARGMAEFTGELRNQGRPRFGRPFWQIAFAFLLVLVLAILAIGPQRVLAQMQAWLRYTGWFGFVEPDQARVLSSPVGQERNGVVIIVTEVIATPERVAVRFISRTPEGSPVELDPPLSNIKLLLPDEKELRAEMVATGDGKGIFGFPGLPPGVDQATLVVPPNPEDETGLPWELPFLLQPVSRSKADASWPAAYRPDNGRASANGVTMDMLAVVQTDQATALQVKFAGDQSTGSFDTVSQGQLFDNLGHAYQPSSDPAYESMSVLEASQEGGAPFSPGRSGEVSSIQTFVFAPLSPSASQATFSVGEVSVDVPADASFAFDPGSNPQVGQIWDLDETLGIAGALLHFYRARLSMAPGDVEQHEPEKWYVLTLWAESPIQNGRRVSSLELEFTPGPHRMLIEGNDEGRIKIQLYLWQLPTESIRMAVHRASLVLYGPWEVTWDLPRSGQGISPHTLFPDDAAETVHGITLQVKKVIASDRLTAVEVAAVEGLLEGSSFWGPIQVPPFDGLYLEDAAGQRYESDESVVWRPDHDRGLNTNLHQLTFPPVPPETSSLSLNIPMIHVTQSVRGSFEVEVPPDLHLSEQALTFRWPRLDGTYGALDVRRPASDPWEVDIPLELGGYRLHFDQARLVQFQLGEYRLVLHGEWLSGVEEGRRPLGFHVASMTRPNGQRVPSIQDGVEIEDAIMVDAQVYREEPGGTWQVELSLPVTDPVRGQVLPGHYRLDMDTASFVIPGPWKISWSMNP